MATSFTLIPTELIDDKNISAEHKIFYGRIYFFCGKNGYIWHRNEVLAEKLNVSISSITRALKVLKDNDYLVVKRKVKKNKIYKHDYERVVWLFDSFHGMEARAKAKKERKQKEKENNTLTLRTFKRLVKKHHAPEMPITKINFEDSFEFKIGFDGYVFIDANGYLNSSNFLVPTPEAMSCWNLLLELYLKDTTLFPILHEAKQRQNQKGMKYDENE